MKNNLKEVKINQDIKISLDDVRAITAEMLQAKVRTSATEYVIQVMNEEVEALCGSLFSHKSKANLARRGGSEKGSVSINGNRVSIMKPRVRKDNKEYPLKTYQKLHSTENLSAFIYAMMLSGISTRSYDKVLIDCENKLGVSKSLASKKFIKESRKSLNEMNIDGVNFGGDMVVVALGVDKQGNKHFIGISQGSTENAEIVADLLGSIALRNIQFSHKVICVLDGSKALRKGVLDHFGKRADIQRCLIHKIRNVEAKLGMVMKNVKQV